MKIVDFKAINIKRLTDVAFKPEGNLIIVGGKNKQGKSSTLDCVKFALGGKRNRCDTPVHEGAEKGEIFLDLEELTVNLELYPDGKEKLVVKGKDGGKHNQTTLKGLVGPLSFDPLEFFRMDRHEQLETFKAVVGLDFTDLDRKRQVTYDARTDSNRSAKEARVKHDERPYDPDATTEEVSVVALSKELEEKRKKNHRISSVGNTLTLAQNRMSEIDDEIAELQADRL